MSTEKDKRVALGRPGQYLTLGLRQQHYAVPIGSVREIIQVCEITPVPRTPDFVQGVINLRGKIIPVVDLKMKLGMAPATNTRQTCIVVIEAEAGMVGTIVDQVFDVVDLAPEQIEPTLNVGADQHVEFLMGMGKLQDRVLILIDIVPMLSKDKFMKEFANNFAGQHSGSAGDSASTLSNFFKVG